MVVEDPGLRERLWYCYELNNFVTQPSSTVYMEILKATGIWEVIMERLGAEGGALMMGSVLKLRQT